MLLPPSPGHPLSMLGGGQLSHGPGCPTAELWCPGPVPRWLSFSTKPLTPNTPHPIGADGKREAAPTIKKRRLVEGGGGRCRHAWSGDGEAFSAWLCHGLRSWRGGSKGAGDPLVMTAGHGMLTHCRARPPDHKRRRRGPCQGVPRLPPCLPPASLGGGPGEGRAQE